MVTFDEVVDHTKRAYPEIKRALELWRLVDDFGVLHIIVSDGNVDDDHIAFCKAAMTTEGGTAEERELLELLERMDEELRFWLWEIR